MYTVAEVAVEGAAYSFDRPYSYLAPEGMALAPGMRVRVPFGRANKKQAGLVLRLRQAPERDRMKYVSDALDREPVLNEEGLALLHYLKEHTLCTYYDALRPLIPAGLGLKKRVYYAAGNLPPDSLLHPAARDIAAYLHKRGKPVEDAALRARFGLSADDGLLGELAAHGAIVREEALGRAMRDEKRTMVRRAEDWDGAPLSAKQKAVHGFLLENGDASLKEVCYYAACTRAVVDALVKKGAAAYYDQPVLRNPYAQEREAAEDAPALSARQRRAYESLNAMLCEENPRPALLYGVTGSGKTQVYLQLIEAARARGKTALVLVPEISLTAQLVEGFVRRFGGDVAVLHSALSLGERMDAWKRVRAGQARIVVGTRSAVFAPLESIGLIVLDEEQEHTYKSEKSPRFHAREVARLRASRHGALLVLASATPSVESYYAARAGRYRLVELAERFGDARLPDVCVVDMKDADNLSDSPALSAVLLDELRGVLARGEQAILLLNRRGYSTLVKCASCMSVADCPHCSVALTYHHANGSLVCHYCGYMQPLVTSCAHCGSELVRYAGAGTQKVEEELSRLLPSARVLRVDMDTTMTRFSHEKYFAAFSAREYDIMVGTQMVAKGLNFPLVTLVGVLSADQSLYGGDFRGTERAFSLLTQVVGRGGRGERPARALVQTFSPENPVIRLAAEQDYPAFYREEILSRKLHLYPPFCTMAGVGFVGGDQDEVLARCKEFLAHFRALAAREYADLPIRLLGPAPSDILKAAGKYRYKLILKCRSSARLRALLAEMLVWFGRGGGQVHAFVDMFYDKL